MAIIKIKRRDGSIAYETEISSAGGSRAVQLGEAVVEAVANGVSLADTVLCGIDLRGARLAGGDFTRADFRYSDLREADFSGSRLPGANLEHSRAQSGIFRGADLEGADLYQVNASSADLTGIRVKGAKLFGAKFGHARCAKVCFEGCDLRRANFSHADVVAAVFRSARLERAVFRNTHAHQADFADAALEGADFTGADVSRARLAARQVESHVVGLAPEDLAARLADRPPQRVLYGYGLLMESPGISRSCGVFQDLEHCRKSGESLMAARARMQRVPEPDLLARGIAAAITDEFGVAESIAAGLTARASARPVELHGTPISDDGCAGASAGDPPVYGYGVLNIHGLPTGAFFLQAAAAKAAAGEEGRAVILRVVEMDLVPEAGQEPVRTEQTRSGKRHSRGRSPERRRARAQSPEAGR